jgi:hypothetical protein
VDPTVGPGRGFGISPLTGRKGSGHRQTAVRTKPPADHERIAALTDRERTKPPADRERIAALADRERIGLSGRLRVGQLIGGGVGRFGSTV